MKKDAIQTRNRKMTTKSKKGRKFSHDSDYNKAMMYHGNFGSQHMGPVTPLMASNQHLPAYSSYASATFPSNLSQNNNMGSYYPPWTSAAQPGFGLSSSMVGAIA